MFNFELCKNKIMPASRIEVILMFKMYLFYMQSIPYLKKNSSYLRLSASRGLRLGTISLKPSGKNLLQLGQKRKFLSYIKTILKLLLTLTFVDLFALKPQVAFWNSKCVSFIPVVHLNEYFE